jgi:hypothetical protein
MHQIQTQTPTVWEFEFGLMSLSLSLGQKAKVTKSLDFVHDHFLYTLLSLFQIFIYICRQAKHIHMLQIIKYETGRSRCLPMLNVRTWFC